MTGFENVESGASMISCREANNNLRFTSMSVSDWRSCAMSASSRLYSAVAHVQVNSGFRDLHKRRCNIYKRMPCLRGEKTHTYPLQSGFV